MTPRPLPPRIANDQTKDTRQQRSPPSTNRVAAAFPPVYRQPQIARRYEKHTKTALAHSRIPFPPFLKTAARRAKLPPLGMCD